VAGARTAAWERHDREWRDPAQIVGGWREAAEVDPDLLRGRASGGWWDAVAAAGVTLLVTREYEHLAMALTVADSKPSVTYMRLPHPSGLVVDRDRSVVHVASSRNPNALYELRPVVGALDRQDRPAGEAGRRPLVPVRKSFLPGCSYLHDLALVDGRLHGNAVGMNAVVALDGDGVAEPVWWPRSVERKGRPDFSINHLQLNSIAAGTDLERSFFSASAAAPGKRRPGHRNYPVDGRGVIFSGATREPVAGGLTRPHSTRLRRGVLWVDNSGYGEVGTVRDGRFEAVARLPGWTRGLAIKGNIAFVGTSRVIPRFRQYAPGLDVDRSVCGVHALDVRSGQVLGSLRWPAGNQIFGIDWAPRRMTHGFPFSLATRRRTEPLDRLFYSYVTDRH
jgi:uncharacterized protein (TIGR03032 family)